MKRRALEAVGLILLGCALLGCPQKIVRGEGPDHVGVEGFLHAEHLGSAPALLEQNGGKPLICGDCHASSADTGWKTVRPGHAEHAPCDGCHADAFAAPPGDLCQVCHTSVDPMTADASPLGEYPRRTRQAELVGAFNHNLHLTDPKVRKDGAALRCDDCHQVGGPEQPYATFPTHVECAPCHAPDKAVECAPSLDDCASCHDAAGPGRARVFVKNDIRFTHGKHRVDQQGNAILCLTCHGSVAQSTKASDVTLPAMATCATCHEDPERTPDRVRIDQCGVCHQDDVESKPLPGNHTAQAPAGGGRGSLAALLRDRIVLAQAAPEGAGETATDAVPRLRDLLPQLTPGAAAAPTLAPAAPAGVVHAAPALTPAVKPVNPNVKPDDHTPIFRVRHEAAARDTDAKCGYCHEGLSGSARDNCQECHAVMRPRSHTLRFRTTAHGRDAARDPIACATCHEVDSCSECHAQRPPSHGPDFSTRHDRAAAFNPRACMTCHTFESTCIDCHVGALGGTGAATQGLRGRIR